MPNHHTTTRVPVDDEYVALIGKAVYIFAYYEWTIIWIMDYLESGFVHRYSRIDSMTSGKVEKEFEKLIDKLRQSVTKISIKELEKIHEEFKDLIPQRNALMHGHPATDSDGSQILNYQTNPSKSIPDMKWSKVEVEKLIQTFDKVAVSAAEVLDKLRS